MKRPYSPRPCHRRWNRIENEGKPYTARTGHTVVHDNGGIYLFGGTDSEKRQQDLYKLELKTHIWEKVKPESGPVPWCRSGAVGVANAGKFYLFGGYDGRGGNYFNDLYVYDFAKKSWGKVEPLPPLGKDGKRKNLKPVIPAARTDHSLVYHNNKLYLFGGTDGKKKFNEVHCFDIATQTWTLLGKNSFYKPVERFGHSAVLYENSLWIFGGWDGKETLGSLWRFDLRTNQWIPMQYEKHSKDAENVKLLNKEYLQHSYKFQSYYNMCSLGKFFRHKSPNWPTTRYRHSAVVYKSNMYIFGGVDKKHNRFQDLVKFSFKTGEWSEVTPLGITPSARTFHRAVVARDYLYLLGGYNGKDRLNDTHSVYLGPLAVSPLETLCAQFIRENYSTMKHEVGVLPSMIVDTVLWTRDESGVLRGGRYNGDVCVCNCLKLSCAYVQGSNVMSDIENEDSSCLECGSPASEHVQIDETRIFPKENKPKLSERLLSRAASSGRKKVKHLTKMGSTFEEVPKVQDENYFECPNTENNPVKSNERVQPRKRRNTRLSLGYLGDITNRKY